MHALLHGLPLAALALACGAGAQVRVGAGSSLDLGSGSLDQGCLPLAVDGTARLQSGQWRGVGSLSIGAGGMLDGGSGTLSLSGDFARTGTFAAGTGRVQVVDGCGLAASAITPDNAFHRLEVTAVQGRLLTLPANAEQTIAGGLVLQGGAGGLLKLRSSVLGQSALLKLQSSAGQSIARIDVADSEASGQPIAPGPASYYQSVKGANVRGWFEGSVPPSASGGAVPVPALSGGAWLLLSALAGLALRRRRLEEE